MERYSILKESDLIVVLPETEIVRMSYPDIEKKLKEDIPFRRNVVFNMSNVDFVNSEGIAFLLMIKEMVEENGGNFAIYNPHRNVKRIMKILSIDKVLNLSDSAEECFVKILDMPSSAHRVNLTSQHV